MIAQAATGGQPITAVTMSVSPPPPTVDDSHLAWLALRTLLAEPVLGLAAGIATRLALDSATMAVTVAVVVTTVLAGADAARTRAPVIPWALGAAATTALSAVLLVAIVAVFSCASSGCF
jgi:uncharacterized membrane protein (UPF0136 family)